MSITPGTVAVGGGDLGNYDTSFYRDFSVTIAEGSSTLSVVLATLSTRIDQISVWLGAAELTRRTSKDTGNVLSIGIWDLDAPAFGALTLRVRCPNPAYVALAAHPLSGVDPVTPRRGVGSEAYPSNFTTRSNATTEEGDLVVGGMVAKEAQTLTTTSGIESANQSVGDPDLVGIMAAAVRAAAGTATTLDWSSTLENAPRVAASVAYIPASAPSAPSAATLAHLLNN
ncbi:hypothetical protein [Gemmatimonas sp. UBA7669]|uniref:hypothetical protein n=1 Tax=Gemmatimonas sp. UBA7669 TaxID=1946568 RepID=UPI0025B7EEFD|nr:hypothetical protein [Gemmatimonas sp. UBA7669]